MKDKIFYTFGALVALYFLFNGLIPRENEKLANRIIYLMNEGYTAEASAHIAKVEFKIIPVDAEYIALMED